jgi:hypothetical protein
MSGGIGAVISVAILLFVAVACSPAGLAVSSGDAATATSSAPSADPNDGPAAAPSASPAEPSADLRVVCDGAGTDIPTPFVKTQPDGVHIRFANTSGQPLDFGLDDATGLAMLGDGIPVEGATFIYTIGTGRYQIGCGESRVAFAVIDPDRLYRPTRLDCNDASGTTGTTDYADDARGPRGALLDVAKAELQGLRPGDVVEPAGYPKAADEHLVRVVRSGRVVAVLGYADDGHGGWLISGTRACAGSHVTVEVPPG